MRMDIGYPLGDLRCGYEIRLSMRRFDGIGCICGEHILLGLSMMKSWKQVDNGCVDIDEHYCGK